MNFFYTNNNSQDLQEYSRKVFDLKLGFRCNNNCIHCVVADKRHSKDISIEDVLTYIRDLPEGTTVQITGGEPSIYDNLPKILRLCKKKKLYTSIQSNATGFSNLDFLNLCVPYIDHVHVAIHSCYKDVHNLVVNDLKDNGDTMYDKTLRGFRNLIACTKIFPLTLSTQTVLSKVNINSLEDTLDFIQGECPGIRMSMTYPHIMGNALQNQHSIIFQYKDYSNILKKCIQKYSSLLFTESIPYCITHPFRAAASIEQDLVSKSFDRKGFDISSGHAIKNYNNLDLQYRRKSSLCKECIYDKECPGVWVEYFHLFKNNFDLLPIREV